MKNVNTARKPKPIMLIVYGAIGILLFVCFLFLNSFVTTVDNGRESFWGYHAHIVRNNDMTKTNFSVGDVVFSETVDANTLHAGDIITFYSDNPQTKGQMISHKIYQVVPKFSGTPTFVTYSTSTGEIDPTVVESYRVVGKCKWSIPGLGYFVILMKYVPAEMHLFFLLVYLMGLVLLTYRFLKNQQNWKEQYAITENVE